MKKAVLLIAGWVVFVFIHACSKEPSMSNIPCTEIPAVEDSTQLLGYAVANGITPTLDTSGMYYQIVNQGTGAFPNGSSKITVTYVGKTMNGNLFDSTTSPITFQLNSLIEGWQYGLPKIQAGGHIKLLIPSALAYGCTGNLYIPANAPVFFDIQLLSVN